MWQVSYSCSSSMRCTSIDRVACCRDDLAWAAAWLYRETGDNAYLSDAYFFYSQHQTQEGDYDKRYLVRFSSTVPLVAAMPWLPSSLLPLLL